MNKPSDGELREAFDYYEYGSARIKHQDTLTSAAQELLELRAKVKELEKCCNWTAERQPAIVGITHQRMPSPQQ